MSISSPEEVTTNHRPVGQSSLDALARLRRSSSLHSRHSSTSADSSIDGAQHTRANNSSSESRNTTPAPDVMAEDDPNRDDRSEEAEPGEVSDDIPVSRSSAAAETVSAVEPTVVSPASEDSSPGSGSDGDDEDEEAGAISDDAMQESDDESEPAAKTTTQQTRNASEIFSSAQSPTPDTPAPDSLHSNTQSDAMEEDDDEDYEPADTLPPIKNGTAKNAQSSSEATIDIETQAESNASQESVDASPQSSQTNDATSANYEVGHCNAHLGGY